MERERGDSGSRRLRPGRDVEAFVLAGGGSRRFGEDKALALLDGRPLLGCSLALLRGLGFNPRVVTRRALDYRALASAFVMAERPDRGPVEGIRVLLRACAAPRALVLAVDMPGMSAAALGLLLEGAAREPGRILCFRDAVRVHPLPGVFPRHPVLARLEGEAPPDSLQALVREWGSPIPWAGDPAEGEAILRNVNRPGDLG